MTARTPGRSSSAGWFTSSYSNEVNACVQVRFDGAYVQIADSKDRGRGPIITVSGPDWDDFVADALGGQPAAALTISAADDGGCAVTGPDGTALHYTAAEWTAFLAGAADGEFRRPVSAR